MKEPKTEAKTGAAEPVASTDLFADLIIRWERKCVALDKLAEDAEKTACEETIARLKTKADVTRSMTVELKREIRKANAAGEPRPPENLKG
jgi:hypothetical protein